MSTQTNKTRYCRDCRWAINPIPIRYIRCNNPKLGVSNVTGEVEPTYCTDVRDTKCNGDWFEPKEAPHIT